MCLLKGKRCKWRIIHRLLSHDLWNTTEARMSLFPVRWHISACRSCSLFSNTQCLSCTRFLSSTRKSWRAAILTPVSKLCLWTRPTFKYPPMLPWASSGRSWYQSSLVLLDSIDIRNQQMWNTNRLLLKAFFLSFNCCFCLSVPTCSTALWSLTRLPRLAAVWLRRWLSSSLAVLFPGCPGEC